MEQKNVIYNIDMLYEARKVAIKFFDDYSSVVTEEKSKAKNRTSGRGLKIWTPKQLLHRLPTALAQLKAANDLSNEIKQVVFSLCQSKEMTKKV